MSCSVYSGIVRPPIPRSYCSLLIEPNKHGCMTFRASGALHRWIKEHSLDTAHFQHLCFSAAERTRFKLLHCHRLHSSAAEKTFRQSVYSLPILTADNCGNSLTRNAKLFSKSLCPAFFVAFLIVVFYELNVFSGQFCTTVFFTSRRLL